MRALASLICGFVFGWGLFISGMLLPTKVLGFLDFLAIPSGNWDPSLAVVMAAGLAVTVAGYALLRPRTPLFESQNQWPTQTAIDTPLSRRLNSVRHRLGLGRALPRTCNRKSGDFVSRRHRIRRGHGDRHGGA